MNNLYIKFFLIIFFFCSLGGSLLAQIHSISLIHPSTDASADGQIDVSWTYPGYSVRVKLNSITDGSAPFSFQNLSVGEYTLIYQYYKNAGWGWQNYDSQKVTLVAGGGRISCIPSVSNYKESNNEYISNVLIGDIDNDSNSDEYTDYTDSQLTNVEIGKDYSLKVTNGNWYNSDVYGVWVDWNQDGDFDDADETIASETGDDIYVVTITPPSHAAIGNSRMRIRVSYLEPATACENTDWGEVEDYTLNVVPSVVGQGFWFKADAGVNGNLTSWTDQSGNGHTANNSGSISKVNNSLNFNPVLNFSGVDRQFEISNAASIQTVVTVNKTPATNKDLSGLIGINGDKGVRLANSVAELAPVVTPYQSWKGNNNTDDWVNTSSGGTGRINGLSTQDMVHDSKWHIANLTRYQALSGNYYLGGYYSGRSYTGEIAEVLALSSAITNTAQIETYLAIKYGITLGNIASPVDYVNSLGLTVWAGSSVYQNNIAGIARDDSPYDLYQKVSSSINTTPVMSSAVTMATSNDFANSNQDASRTNLGNGDFLIWGDNAEASSLWQDRGDYQTVDRKWKLEKTGSVGVTYFQINLNSYPGAVGDYLLIVDDDQDVSNGISNTYVLTNTSGDLYSTSFTPLAGTSYFTIGYYSGSNITVADCLGAKTICNAVYKEPSPETIGLGGVLNELPIGDCIPEEKNGIWYSFSPQNTVDANLKFSITPDVDTNDYDWVIFDMTNTTCEDLASIDITTSEVFVSGSTYGQNGSNGPTGADSNQGSGNCNGPGIGNGPQWNGDVLVKPGHNYMLYVSNWSEEKDGYVISFDQGGSAIVYDDIPPELDGVVQACYGSNELKVNFTEILPCNSIDIDKVSLVIGGVSYNVTDITSSNCDSGGEGSVAYVFILDRPISSFGSSNLSIEASGIADMCGNVNSVTSNMSFNVYNTSVVLSVNKSPACAGESVIVTANANGGFGACTYEFYLNGNLLVSDAQYSIVGNQLSSNTFVDGDAVKVIVTDEDACSVTSTEINLLISSLPVKPTGLVSQSYCQGATIASLVASSGSNAIDWYAVSINGTVLNNTDILSTGTYYAESRDVSSGCVSSSRLAVTTVGDSEVPVINCLSPNVVWSEDFDSYSDYTFQATNNGTTWQGYYLYGYHHKAAVIGDLLEMRVEEGSEVRWNTNYIDISAENSVQVSFDLSSWAGSAADGYIEFWARVDADLGGTYQLFQRINGAAVNQIVSSPVLKGKKLELEIRVIKGSSVGIYYVDNISITSLPVKSVDSGQCFYTVQGNEFDAIATDNCSLSSLTYTLTGSNTGSGLSLSGVKLEQGLTTVNWTAIDASGNKANCSFDLKIEDKENPVAVCKDITIELDGTGNASLLASALDDGSSDNCNIASMSVTPNTFDCSDEGVNVVSLKVIDSNGNSTICNANVTVVGMPDNSLSVLGDIKCVGEDASVTIQNSELGVSYSLYKGVSQLGSSVNGTGGNLNIIVLASDLSVGDNLIIVKASRGACELDLLNNATILINSKPKPIGVFFE